MEQRQVRKSVDAGRCRQKAQPSAYWTTSSRCHRYRGPMIATGPHQKNSLASAWMEPGVGGMSRWFQGGHHHLLVTGRGVGLPGTSA